VEESRCLVSVRMKTSIARCWVKARIAIYSESVREFVFFVQTFRSEEETDTWVAAPRQSGLLDNKTRLSWKLFSQEDRST